MNMMYKYMKNLTIVGVYNICCQLAIHKTMGSGGRALERLTVNRGDLPLSQFRSLHICLCLSEETLKANGPFYLVSMPGEVKDPTQGVNV